MCGGCIVAGQYIRTGGTSMAAPMISGLVADVLQLHPGWTPDQVKGALMSPFARSRFGLDEVSGLRMAFMPSPPSADQGLTPNTLLNPTTGDIDYTRSSWSRSRWSTASGALSATFARSSWSCDCSRTSSGDIDPSRSSWSRGSWSTYADPTDEQG
jgi:serine protease AprX